MIEDLRRLESGSELETDLCVIGSGAAGIAIAREFLSTNTEVLLLESGGFSRAAETDSLNAGQSTGIDPASLTEGRGRSLGGSTALWAGQCLPPGPGHVRRAPVGAPQRVALRRPRAREPPAQGRGAVRDRGRGVRRGRVGRLRGRARPGVARALGAPLLGLVPPARPRPPLPRGPGRLAERAAAVERDRDRAVRRRGGTGPQFRDGGHARGQADTRAGPGVRALRRGDRERAHVAGVRRGKRSRSRRPLLRRPSQCALRHHRPGERRSPPGALWPALPGPDPLPASPRAERGGAAIPGGALLRRPPGVRLRRGLRDRGRAPCLPGGPRGAAPAGTEARARPDSARRPEPGTRGLSPLRQGALGPGHARASDAPDPRRAGTQSRQPGDPLGAARSPRSAAAAGGLAAERARPPDRPGDG